MDREYREWVERVWSRLEQLTGSTVFYLDGETIASYCPACREGTIRVRFLNDRSPPEITITSNANPGHCSLGCAEVAIAEVMFG